MKNDPTNIESNEGEELTIESTEKVPIIRCISGTVRYLNEKYPGNEITAHMIRIATLNGLKYRSFGGKIYVDVNNVIEYFSGEEA